MSVSVPPNQPDTYSTPTDVTNTIGTPFTTTSFPTIDQLKDIIQRADDYIDNISGHNWLTNTVVDEYHDAFSSGVKAGIILPRNQPLISVQRLEYYAIGGQWTTGVQAFPGDPLNKTGLEPFYVDLKKNQVIWHRLRLDGRQRYRLAYTWGYAAVPDLIRDLSATLAARELLTFWAGKFLPAEDVDSYTERLNQKIRRLTFQAASRTGGLTI